MFVNYRTLGFILKKKDREEFDQQLTVYTKNFGKLEILGKAIRKVSSKLRSGAEVFYLSEIEFIQGKNQKILTDAILIEKFENLRKDLKKLKIAYQIAETFNELVRGEGSDEKIWQLLNEIFKKLNNWKVKDCLEQDSNFEIWKPGEIIYYYFIWNLFSVLGYQPQLYYCVLCQNKLVPEKLFFSSKDGGVVCQKCQNRIKLIKKIPVGTIKILRIILKKDWSILTRLKIDELNLKSLQSVTDEYYSYISTQFVFNKKEE